MTVRLANPQDASRLHDLAAATFPLACPPDTTASSIAEFIGSHLSENAFVGYLADPSRQIFLGEMDGEAAGYTMVVFGEPGDADDASAVGTRPTAELSKCYALPAAHGTGLAAALVREGCDAARSRGTRSMWLGVNQQNARAIRFYEKQGFVRVGTRKFLVGDRYEDDFVLERAL